MLNIGPFEVLLVLVIALLVIGPDDLPDAVRKVGRFLGQLRKYGDEVQEEVRAMIEDAASIPNSVEGKGDGVAGVDKLGDGGEASDRAS